MFVFVLFESGTAAVGGDCFGVHLRTALALSVAVQFDSSDQEGNEIQTHDDGEAEEVQIIVGDVLWFVLEDEEQGEEDAFSHKENDAF